MEKGPRQVASPGETVEARVIESQRRCPAMEIFSSHLTVI
jgi:hypothetical protein